MPAVFVGRLCRVEFRLECGGPLVEILPRVRFGNRSSELIQNRRHHVAPGGLVLKNRTAGLLPVPDVVVFARCFSRAIRSGIGCDDAARPSTLALCGPAAAASVKSAISSGVSGISPFCQ